MRKLLLATMLAVASCTPAFAAPHAMDGYCEAVAPPLAELQEQASADNIVVAELTALQRANVETNLRAFGLDVPDLEHVYLLAHPDGPMVLAIVAADGCVVHMGKVDQKTLDKIEASPDNPA